MTNTLPTAREGLAEASDFARDVWRDCWPVMLVIVIGRTLVFMGHHVSETEWRPWLWPKLGEVMSLAYIPLFGALYRLGVGGEALESLGWGGFQWTGVEWRLLGVWIVLGFALSLCAAPLALVSLPLLYLFQHRSAVSLGPFGGWSLASILLAPFWLAFAGFVLFMWGRLGLAAAFTTARGRIAPFAGWSLTRGLGWTIGLAWLATQLPTVIGWIALWAMGMAEAGDMASGPAEIWPLGDAVGAGAVIGVLAAVIQAPLSVGLLSGLYRWLAQDEAPSVSVPRAEHAPPSLVMPEAAVPTEPVIDEPHGALSVWPHTVLPRVAVVDAGALVTDAATQEMPVAHEAEALPAPAPPEPDPEPAREPEAEPEPESEIEPPEMEPDPPLASGSEAGQTSHTDPEPHA